MFDLSLYENELNRRRRRKCTNSSIDLTRFINHPMYQNVIIIQASESNELRSPENYKTQKCQNKAHVPMRRLAWTVKFHFIFFFFIFHSPVSTNISISQPYIHTQHRSNAEFFFSKIFHLQSFRLFRNDNLVEKKKPKPQNRKCCSDSY